MESPLRPLLPADPAGLLIWSGLFGSARGLAIAQAVEQHRGPTLFIGRGAQFLQQLEDEIRFYRAEQPLPVLPFPDLESLPYDAVSPHPDIVSQRLAALAALPNLKRGLLLTTAAAVMHRICPREYVAAHSFQLQSGERLDLAALRAQLAQAAYRNVSQVMEPGEFAIRGGLIDIFPMGASKPFRVDLLDETIETIREFDIATQRSGATLDAIRLLPAREFPLTETAIQRFRQAFRARFEGDPQRSPIYRDVSQGLCPAGIEYYLPLFFDSTATLFDYLPHNTLCIVDDGVAEAVNVFEREIAERHRDRRLRQERPSLAPNELFLSAYEFHSLLPRFTRIEIQELSVSDQGNSSQHQDTVRYDAPPPPALPFERHSHTPHHLLFEHLASFPGRVLLVAETAGRRETLSGLLAEHKLRPELVANWSAFLTGSSRLGLTVANLEKGLLLRDPALSVVTEPQLYGERAAQRRRRLRSAPPPEAIIRNLADLRPGDAVVHEDHGVGRFLGLQALDVGDGLTEFLALEYADGDKLYLPVLSLHLISRYTGTDPEHVPLHKLGADAWDKAKRRALEKAHDAAVELLEVQALRTARQGHAFAKRNDCY
ncbi:MAG: transcription-repair coupling factor, partial [Pseudomonadota bacterium]